MLALLSIFLLHFLSHFQHWIIYFLASLGSLSTISRYPKPVPSAPNTGAPTVNTNIAICTNFLNTSQHNAHRRNHVFYSHYMP